MKFLTYSLILSILIFNPISLYAISNDDIAFPPDSKPYGKSYADWSKDYWFWWLNLTAGIPKHDIPNSQGPCLLGSYNQTLFAIDTAIVSGEVTFDCTIPSDKPIFLYGIAELCSYGDKLYDDDNREIKNDKDLITCVEGRNPHAKVSINVDGFELENIKQYTLRTDYFNFTHVEGNYFEHVPGTFRSLNDGIFVMLKPLPPGDHKIVIGLTQIMEEKDQDIFAQVTYNMHVK